jgi:hypothetical protein
VCVVDIADFYFDVLYIVQCALVSEGCVCCGYSGLLFFYTVHSEMCFVYSG